uniref:Uncharacterized protein n=1 Tax=Ficedula albicollis TaxID=59894 RepID=A0A803W4M7_FICAL
MLALNQFPRGDQSQAPSRKHWAAEAVKEGPPVSVKNEIGEWETGWKLIVTGRGYAAVNKDDVIKWCPLRSIKPSYCTYLGYWFCGYWGGETIVTEAAYQKVLTKADTPETLVTMQSPEDKEEIQNNSLGRMWSVFIHCDPSILIDPYDHGTVIQIIRSPSSNQYIAIGPNEAIAPREEKRLLATAAAPEIAPKPIGDSISPMTTSEAPPHSLFIRMLYAEKGLLFIRMLYAAFMSLNVSHPNLTRSCWLCYDSKPPFYEGIGLNIMFGYSKAPIPKQCKWNTPRKGITLKMVSGQGVCIGSQLLATQNKQLCNISVLTKL